MSNRFIGAILGMAGIILVAVAYFLFWPHPRRSSESGSKPVYAASSEGKPSPLTPASPIQGPLPNEHVGPPPAPPVVPVEQTPQSLVAMIQSLATQPNAIVRVVNVKHDGGDGCHGTLVFTLEDFRFECGTGETLRITRSDVGQVHKNGVQVLKSGKGRKLGRKYHFSMAGRGRDLVEYAFAEWMKLRT